MALSLLGADAEEPRTLLCVQGLLKTTCLHQILDKHIPDRYKGGEQILPIG